MNANVGKGSEGEALATGVANQVRALRDVTPQGLSEALSFIDTRIAGEAFARYHQTKHNNSLRSEPEGELLASLHNSNSIFQNYQQQPPSEPLPSHQSANGGDSLRQLKLRPAPESAKCQLEKTPGSLDSSSSSHLGSTAKKTADHRKAQHPRKRDQHKSEKQKKTAQDALLLHHRVKQSLDAVTTPPLKPQPQPQPQLPSPDATRESRLGSPSGLEGEKAGEAGSSSSSSEVAMRESYMQRLRELECENATMKREKQRREIHEKQWLYGRPTSSLGFNEWHGGEVPREVKAELQRCHREQEHLLSSKRKGQKLNVTQQLRQQMLARQMARIHEKMVKVDEERENFYFAWRRFHQEETSHYLKNIALTNKYPLLENGRYLVLSLLGKGGFSEVYQGYDLLRNRRLALKLHHISEAWTPAQKENFLKHAQRETATHAKMEHPHIIKCYGTHVVDSSRFFTLLEYCQGCDLLEYQRRCNGRLDEREAKLVLAQLLSALHYMSRSEPGRGAVIHYDIKPQNILLSEQGFVKVADFGLCKLVGKDEAGGGAGSVEITSQGVGTYWYLPPETFYTRTESYVPTITQKVDVWSVGVVFFEMLYGVKPFGEGMTPSAIVHEKAILCAKEVSFPDELKKLKSDNLQLLRAKGAKVSPDAKNFIRNCLKHSEADRYSVHDACSDRYIADLINK